MNCDWHIEKLEIRWRENNICKKENIFIRKFFLHHHYNEHHQFNFNVCFPCLHGLNGFIWSIFFSQALADFFSFGLPQITSIHVLLGHHLGKLPQTLEILHLLDQILSSVLSRSINNCSLLSCRHSLMLFNFSLFVSCLQ